MSIEYQKVKSASKQIIVKGPVLSRLVLNTMKTISAAVGATLGPGGQPALIERFEHGLPPIITKDGVTVMRSLGFDNSTQQTILEAARDAAVKTASEAGDGTTTATVLSEAIVRHMDSFCNLNPTVSRQRVVRRLEEVFSTIIEPAIKANSIKAAGNDALLRSVALVSSNSDGALADAVMQCFKLVGDQGNVTIVERSGPTKYEVEEIDGYPVDTGYDVSCGKFYPVFINDSGRQKVSLREPVFLLYHGRLNDIQTLLPILNKVGDEFMRSTGRVPGETSDYKHYNVVVVATDFSEKVLATFAHATSQPDSINIYPMLVPMSPISNGQKQLLDDLAVVTGSTVFDPLTKPLGNAELRHLGPGVGLFEAGRYRTMIIERPSPESPYMGDAVNEHGELLFGTYEDAVIERVSELETYLEAPESEMDGFIAKDRLARLTGGIAKLHVVGSSNGELKEKKDRAEDAVCAVRGAIKHGALPGGGWMLLKLTTLLDDKDPILRDVLKPALQEPVLRLLSNCGFTSHEQPRILEPVLEALGSDKPIIYDAYNQRHGDPIELGVLDSVPAVLEAIRNSVSIASLLGTLGCTVVFNRNAALETKEASETQEWLRNADTNEADNRP